MTTLVDVLKTIADDKSLALFNTIAVSNGDSDLYLGALKLTRKQYYSRLAALLKAGLVKREMGNYSLTTFGILVYHTQETIGRAVDQYWKFKAIDSIRASGNGELPQEQVHIIIDKLIANQEIKNILIKQIKEKPPIYETEINQISPLNLYHKKTNAKQLVTAIAANHSHDFPRFEVNLEYIIDTLVSSNKLMMNGQTSSGFSY
jgi:hypothetical protein